MLSRTYRITVVLAAVLLVISLVFPYDRFSIAIEHSTIIRIGIGAVAIGVGVRGLLYLR